MTRRANGILGGAGAIDCRRRIAVIQLSQSHTFQGLDSAFEERTPFDGEGAESIRFQQQLPVRRQRAKTRGHGGSRWNADACTADGA